MEKFLKVWKKYSFILIIAFILLELIYLRFTVISVICMIAPVVVSIFKGRFWYGNLCPRGNYKMFSLSFICKPMLCAQNES